MQRPCVTDSHCDSGRRGCDGSHGGQWPTTAVTTIASPGAPRRRLGPAVGARPQQQRPPPPPLPPVAACATRAPRHRGCHLLHEACSSASQCASGAGALGLMARSTSPGPTASPARLGRLSSTRPLQCAPLFPQQAPGGCPQAFSCAGAKYCVGRDAAWPRYSRLAPSWRPGLACLRGTNFCKNLSSSARSSRHERP